MRFLTATLIIFTLVLSGASWFFIPNGAAWNPTQLPNLVYFLDVKDSSKVTLSGSDITQIVDSSSNAYVFSQGSSGNRPDIVAADLNGKDVMSFDGSNDFLSSNIGGTLTTHSIFIIARSAANAEYKVLNTTTTTFDNEAMTLEIGGSNNLNWWFTGPGGIQAATGSNTFPINTWHKVAATYQSGDGKIYINDFSSAAGTTTRASGFMDISPAAIGYDGGAGFGGFNGKMATVIVTSGIFSSTDFTNLTAWALAEYGI